MAKVWPQKNRHPKTTQQDHHRTFERTLAILLPYYSRFQPFGLHNSNPQDPI